MNLARIRKALAAAAGSFSGAVATAAADGTLTGRDWASAAGVGILVGVLTWAVPNKPAEPQP